MEPSREGCGGLVDASVIRTAAERLLGWSHTSGLAHRGMVAAPQEIVQHLVLDDATLVHAGLRHVNRVRRPPPAGPAVGVGRAGVLGTGLLHVQLKPRHAGSRASRIISGVRSTR